MPTPRTTLAALVLRGWARLVADERGTTTENVIWIAAAAVGAMLVTKLIWSAIVDAAHAIVLH